NILKIELLNEVADRLIEDFTVVVDSQKLSSDNVQMLQSEIVEASAKTEGTKEPSTSLYFEVCNAIKNYHVRLFCRGRKVRVTTGLVEYVRSLKGISCKINDHDVVDDVPVAVAADDDQPVVMADEELLPDD
ncbi:MAG: hypothetical protein J6W69_05440, partial [Bacteroidales bacterium]|nr:hypothetical protein [Bacteroidales bacterium]